jgi:hypothetical protein
MVASAFLTSLASRVVCLTVGAILFVGGIIILIVGLLQKESAFMIVDGRSQPRAPIQETGSSGTVVFCEHCGSRVYQASGLCPECGEITVGQRKNDLGKV